MGLDVQCSKLQVSGVAKVVLLAFGAAMGTGRARVSLARGGFSLFSHGLFSSVRAALSSEISVDGNLGHTAS